MKKSFFMVLTLALSLSLGGCGYNQLQQTDEQAKAAWSEVLNQYQRRADLIPNLVQTVKGFAAQERERARSRISVARWSRCSSVTCTVRTFVRPRWPNSPAR